MTNRDWTIDDEPKPQDFTTDALLCAIGACGDSQHESDRAFAEDCRAELKRRLLAQPYVPTSMRWRAERAGVKVTNEPKEAVHG